MKTTVELPDAISRQARAAAASRGMTFRQFFTEAIEERLRQFASEPKALWMAGFGQLSDLSDENRRILKAIDEEFETLSRGDLP